MVFYEIKPIGAIPEHSHGEQWGVVIEGEAELVVNGVKKICRKGDHYHNPSGALHLVTIRTPVKAIDFFAEANRHKAKPDSFIFSYKLFPCFVQISMIKGESDGKKDKNYWCWNSRT